MLIWILHFIRETELGQNLVHMGQSQVHTRFRPIPDLVLDQISFHTGFGPTGFCLIPNFFSYWILSYRIVANGFRHNSLLLSRMQHVCLRWERKKGKVGGSGESLKKCVPKTLHAELDYYAPAPCTLFYINLERAGRSRGVKLNKSSTYEIFGLCANACANACVN